MRIKKQRETFAYHLADMSTPFIIGDSVGGRGDGNPAPNLGGGNSLDKNPWTANPGKFNAAGEAEKNRAGPKVPKRVVPPGDANAGGGGGGSNTARPSGGGYQGSGKSGRDGLNPGAMSFYDELAAEHPDLSMGGYNPVVDQPWDEHATGDAIDVMISDLERGNAIRDRALSRPDIEHVIWQQQLFSPGGGVQGMPDRGSPTENHFDHVHIKLRGG